MKRIAVFCASALGGDPVFREAAQRVATLAVGRGLGLVYGGGCVGLMGILADAGLAAGGEVIGVIPEFLMQKEVGHSGLTQMVIVQTMHERKARLAELADAFVMLPGGVGTLEEFIEAVTWAQLGLHRKPCGLLNVAGYYDPLLEMFDRAVTAGFIRPEHRALITEERDPEALLDRLLAAQPPYAEKWSAREQPL
jgi:uncharacterized protein (TIGR00730 family)